MQKTSQNVYDYLYQKEGQAPWTFEEPPEELAKLVESGMIKSCKTLDVGCGEGYISTYLASKGFDVTGIDISSNAINLAKKHAAKRGVKCKFMQMEWKQLSKIKDKFDFILDWRFLHEVANDKEREVYVNLVSNLLKRRGTYLSVAFSGEFKKWGKGKLRKSPIGTILCLPHNRDLEKLFAEDFDIIKKSMIKLQQKDLPGGVTSYFFLMEKRN
ncbi:MAG: class I SAM-dependent methyltransferase [Candidatus Aenigmarchaeota archaeon]|nr:class I SAM-dependent methyltransferase [Candidatus Aenigmarchaeota archaeon]